MDLFPQAVAAARERTGGEFVCANLESLPVRADFDLVTAFDVIEHLDEPVVALRSLRAVMKPSAWLVVTVPAHRWLWSAVDVEAHHRRRYTRRALRNELEQAGFKVDSIRAFMGLLLPAMMTKRVIGSRLRLPWRPARRSSIRSELSPPVLVNRLIEVLLAPESLLIRKRVGMPIGTSLVGIARI